MGLFVRDLLEVDFPRCVANSRVGKIAPLASAVRLSRLRDLIIIERGSKDRRSSDYTPITGT